MKMNVSYVGILSSYIQVFRTKDSVAVEMHVWECLTKGILRKRSGGMQSYYYIIVVPEVVGLNF